MNAEGDTTRPVTSRDVWKTWLPLALSWLMMGIELPLLSAVVARLANPEINLGAYGGVVFPLSLLIEAPIIMLLTASTKLSRDLTSYLDYATHESNDSMANTPPMFAIYVMGKVLRWMRAEGGLATFEQRATQRADLLYGTIDSSDGWYSCPVDEASRSHMNIVFRLPDEDLEKRFVAEAADAGMVNLKGHRSVGGIRASVYNALPMAAVEDLVEFMAGFRTANS